MARGPFAEKSRNGRERRKELRRRDPSVTLRRVDTERERERERHGAKEQTRSAPSRHRSDPRRINSRNPRQHRRARPRGTGVELHIWDRYSNTINLKWLFLSLSLPIIFLPRPRHWVSSPFQLSFHKLSWRLHRDSIQERFLLYLTTAVAAPIPRIDKKI